MAFVIAAEYPKLVKKTAVASTTPGLSSGGPSSISEWIEKAEAGDKEGLYTAFARIIYPEDIFRQYEGLIPAAAAAVTDEDLHRFVILARAVRGYTMKDRIKKLRGPLFAVASRSDRIFGEDTIKVMLNAFRDLPGFEYYIYDGYGHALYDTAPDFKERLYAFFEG